MAKRAPTPEQLDAINTRGKTLLVSAAAGSGKTHTLINRIIASLLREDEPEDINRILIVTFTNAATDEVKKRISDALTEAVEAHPENARLSRQLTLLPMAKIFTIDAFCNDILKRNADRAGVPPNYRIADSAEVAILSFSILEGLIGAIYDGALPELSTAEEFSALADALTSSKKNSELEEVLLKLYEKTKSLPEGVRVFHDMASEYASGDPCDNIYTSYAVKRLSELGVHYASALSKSAGLLGGTEYDKCAPVLISDADIARALCKTSDYFAARELLDTLSFSRMPTVKDKSAELARALAIRADFKKDVREIRDKLFFYTKEEWRELYSGLHSKLSSLARIISRFDEIYSLEKKKRAMLEYSDIEKYTYMALYDENGEKSDIARATEREFSSVYIDEYQDVNALQNKIFEAISTPTNRFMVGDIKQSIYGFRHADPDIFAALKRSFPSLSESQGSNNAAIFMSSNFRSDPPIIDFINGIFDTVFPLVGEGIGYVSGDRLSAAKLYDTPPNFTASPELMLISADREEGDEEESYSELRRALETKYVAKRIAELLSGERLNNGEPIQPRDIAIVIRENRQRMSDYADALAAYGIPSQKSDNRNFFLNSEVLLALALLNSIDNPEKDIYLAAVMASPIFGFTPDELFLIKHGSEEVSLHSSLKKYCHEHPDFEKGTAALGRLAFYRTLAEGMNIDAFILRLYNDTGILQNARALGGEENLLLLYDYAKRFASSKYKGLYSFIKFINNIISRGTKFDGKIEEAEENSVVITTVHGSKGLQYPVVFYCDTDSAISNKDSSDRVIFADKFGMSLRLRSPGGLALVDNPIQNILIDRETRRGFEEELRVIYVALTRAGERLYISAAIGEDSDKYLERLEYERDFLDEYSIYSLTSPIKIMLATKASGKTTLISSEGELGEAYSIAKGGDTDTRAESFEPISTEELQKRLSFSYSRPHMTRLPEKLSISRLTPTVLDGTESEWDEDEVDIERAPRRAEKRGILPEFYTGSAEDESARRGIAAHTFLQFFDMDSLLKNGAEEELSRLGERGFLSEENLVRVKSRLNEIKLFEKSELLRQMRSAKRLWREFRFTTELPARYFTRDPEKKRALEGVNILTQGVIDCLIEDEGGELHLVDYKTDRLSQKELSSRELARQKLTESHALQLSYYSLAIEKIFGKKPRELRVYSLPLGDCVEIERIDFE